MIFEEGEDIKETRNIQYFEREQMTLDLWELANRNDTKMLNLLAELTPRGETHIKFYNEIEKKYNLPPNETVETAALLWDLTYDFWSVSRKDINSPEDQKLIESKLDSIFEYAQQLSSKTVESTHQVRERGAIDKINEIGVIYASSEKRYFEGDGVYFGILGGYQTWGAETITLDIDMSNCLPIITGKYDSEAMLNVLAEGVDIHTGEPVGIQQYIDPDNSDLNDWQVTMLRRHIDGKIDVVDGIVVVDTLEPPIVWGSISKALKIPHIMTSDSYEIYKEDIALYEYFREQNEDI